MCAIGLDDNCWLSCGKPEEKIYFIWLYFINKVRARVYKFSVAFRRGTGKGRVRFCIYNSHLFRRKIHGNIPPVSVLKPKTEIGSAVDGYWLSGREGMTVRKTTHPCWGWPPWMASLPSVGLTCTRGFIPLPVCWGPPGVHFLCLEKRAAELTPFFPVLTPKSSTHRSWGQCLRSQDLSLSPLGTTLISSLAPLTKGSQGFLSQLIFKQRRNFK